MSKKGIEDDKVVLKYTGNSVQDQPLPVDKLKSLNKLMPVSMDTANSKLEPYQSFQDPEVAAKITKIMESKKEEERKRNQDPFIIS